MATVDRNAHLTLYEYDELNRLTTETDALGGIGEKLRLYPICQAYCYNSYYGDEKLAGTGFFLFIL